MGQGRRSRSTSADHELPLSVSHTCQAHSRLCICTRTRHHRRYIACCRSVWWYPARTPTPSRCHHENPLTPPLPHRSCSGLCQQPPLWTRQTAPVRSRTTSARITTCVHAQKLLPLSSHAPLELSKAVRCTCWLTCCCILTSDLLQVGDDVVLRLEFIEEGQMKVRMPRCHHGACCGHRL